MLHSALGIVLVRGSVDDGGSLLNEISLELGNGKKYIQATCKA